MPHPADQKAKTYARILHSATELFARYGFSKVSIGQVMKLARMTHGAFYAHFESKEALYTASIQTLVDRCRPARLVKGPLSVQHLTELVNNYLSLRELDPPCAPKAGSRAPAPEAGAVRREPSPEAILLNDLNGPTPAVRASYEQAYGAIRRLLERRLRALARLRAVPFPADRDAIRDRARVILATLVGGVAIARSLPESADDERRALLAAAQRQIFALVGVEASPPAATMTQDPPSTPGRSESAVTQRAVTEVSDGLRSARAAH